MKRKFFGFVTAAFFGATAVGSVTSESDVTKWDPAMAANGAVVDTNGVKWIDGRFLPLEGRAFDDTEDYYDRLPACISTNVNGGVREMKHHTSGMLFRFRTDSTNLVLRWTLREPGYHMPHMTDIGSGGLDIYRRGAVGGWEFVASSHQARKDPDGALTKRISWMPGDECLINLPLYNGIRRFELGVAADARVDSARPHAADKPVVFYGTSITHGGCATRPGLGFVNMVGRDLDVPVVGLGFSGSGVMELEMSDVLARIDASCYVLDCLWNMGTIALDNRPGRNVEENYERFIRNLRAKRPDVPIVMAEACDVFLDRSPRPRSGSLRAEAAYIRSLYEKLRAEGWKNLVYLPKGRMFSGDTEGTVDGCHPNDLGMKSLSRAFGEAIRTALGETLNGRPNCRGSVAGSGREEIDDAFASLELAKGIKIRLWPEQEVLSAPTNVPYVVKNTREGNVRLTDVAVPELVWFPTMALGNRPAVLVCPGGAYRLLSYTKEGTSVAEWLNGLGCHAFVLKYTCPDKTGGMRALVDAKRAMSLLRERAKDYCLDSDRIGAIGFSAGANLVARLSTNWRSEGDSISGFPCRPDFAMLVYPARLVAADSSDPVRSLALRPDFPVDGQTPPAFIVQAEDDPVNVENAIAYYAALKRAGVKSEMHLYEHGGHGFGLIVQGLPIDGWREQAESWLYRMFNITSL